MYQSHLLPPSLLSVGPPGSLLTGRSLHIELVTVLCSDITTLQYEDTLIRPPPVSIPGQGTGL